MTPEERIAALEARVSELERLMQSASKGKASSASVLADCEKASSMTLPARLHNETFIPVWQEFCKHRTTLAIKGNINRKKFPWTQRAATAVLNKAQRWGTAMAIEAMNTSMDKGWADIFEPDTQANHNGKGNHLYNPL